MTKSAEDALLQQVCAASDARTTWLETNRATGKRHKSDKSAAASATIRTSVVRATTLQSMDSTAASYPVGDVSLLPVASAFVTLPPIDSALPVFAVTPGLPVANFAATLDVPPVSSTVLHTSDTAPPLVGNCALPLPALGENAPLQPVNNGVLPVGVIPPTMSLFLRLFVGLPSRFT